MNCTNCGKELIEGAKFCLECGTKVPEANPVLNCKGCGKELVAGAKFCLECGAKVGEQNDNMILVCGKCGAIPHEGKKFCSKCGADMSVDGVMKPKEKIAKVEEVKTGESQDQMDDTPKIIEMKSQINQWSFTVSESLIEALEMETAKKRKIEDKKDNTYIYIGDFAIGVERNGKGLMRLLAAEKRSLSEQVKLWAGSNGKVININGIGALYYREIDAFEFRIFSFIEKNKSIYQLQGIIPPAFKEIFSNDVDAFIYSFKLNDLYE